MLFKLVFAVASNPLLSKDQATEVLQYLKPLVTVYQEEQLVGTISDAPQPMRVDDEYINVYTTVAKAIRSHQRISFVAPHHQYTRTNSIKSRDISYRVSFTPKYILHFEGGLYVIGHNNQTKYIEAFDLKDITKLIIFPTRDLIEGERINKQLSDIDPMEYIRKLIRKR